MSRTLLTERINTYFGVFIVTLFGAGASLIIIHIASQESYALIGSSTVAYAQALGRN